MDTIASLMESSNSIIDLEAKVSSVFDQEFHTLKTYLSFLEKQYYAENNITFDYKSLSPIEGLPCITEEVDCKIFTLYGITHGSAQPGMRLSTRVKDYINRQIEEIGKENLFFEQRFNNLFNLDSSNQLSDIYSTGTNKKTYRGVGFFFKNKLPLTILFFIVNQYSKSIKTPRSKDELDLYLTSKSIENEEYQQKQFEFIQAYQLPMPIELEKNYLSENTKINNAIKNKVAGMDIKSNQERSLWTANQLLKVAQEKQLESISYLGGMAHIPDIAYFLRHPDYSFEPIMQYAAEWASRTD